VPNCWASSGPVGSRGWWQTHRGGAEQGEALGLKTGSSRSSNQIWGGRTVSWGGVGLRAKVKGYSSSCTHLPSLVVRLPTQATPPTFHCCVFPKWGSWCFLAKPIAAESLRTWRLPRGGSNLWPQWGSETSYCPVFWEEWSPRAPADSARHLLILIPLSRFPRTIGSFTVPRPEPECSRAGRPTSSVFQPH
jgi:hypothetical protein